jgi:hypothetical protein
MNRATGFVDKLLTANGARNLCVPKSLRDEVTRKRLAQLRKKVPRLACLKPGRFRLTHITIFRIEAAPFSDSSNVDAPQIYHHHSHFYIGTLGW